MTSPSGGDDNERSVFDIHATEQHAKKRRGALADRIYGRNTINLRPHFRFRHPWLLVVIIIILGGAAFFGIKSFLTRGDVQDFSPTTCLGTWEDPSAAAGIPETAQSASSSFSTDNSAIYDVSAASGTEIYCGAFIPPSFSTSGILTSVSLSLVWQVEATSATSATVTSTIATSTLTAVPDDATTTAPLTEVTSTAPSEPTSTPDITTSTTPIVTSSSDDDASASDTDTTVAPSPPPPSPPPSETTTTDNISFISKLIPFAFAQTIIDTSTDSSTVILGPPLIANLASTSASTSDMLEASGTVYSTSSAIVLPPPTPDEDFLEVSYSINGQTWVNIGTVNVNDLPNFTITLPITDWTDLQNLQIRVQGIPTTQDPIPVVYLDGMIMEVNYVVPPPLVSTAPPIPAVPQSAPVVAPKYVPPVPVRVLDPDAKQTCAVTPFSQTSTPGQTLQYGIALTPSYNNSHFILSTGNLPNGVTSAIQQPAGSGAATTSLVLTISSSTALGSFNSLVIYQEAQTNGTMLSNFCQFNFVIGNE